MKTNKAILFDFGGTLDTDGVHWSERFAEIYREFSIRVPSDVLREAFLDSDRFLSQNGLLRHANFRQNLFLQMFHQFEYLKSNLPDFEIDTLTVEQIADNAYSAAAACIVRNTEMLRCLGSEYKLALVSNCDGNLDIICREFGLDTVFDEIIDSEIVGLRKPDPAIWALALERLGAEAASSFAVGDSYSRDIAPAKKLNCHTIWLRGKSWETIENHDSADHIIKNLSEISSVLKLY